VALAAGTLLTAGGAPAAAQAGDSVPGERVWAGDALFLLSSVLWAGFTLLIRIWRIDAVRATSVVAVLSLCVVVPIYFRYRGWAHLAELPRAAFVFQAVLQGLLQSVITIMAFSRAVLFPAIVPAISVLIGIPTLGEIPTALQLAGVVIVSAGMLVAVAAARAGARA